MRLVVDTDYGVYEQRLNGRWTILIMKLYRQEEGLPRDHIGYPNRAILGLMEDLGSENENQAASGAVHPHSLHFWDILLLRSSRNCNDMMHTERKTLGDVTVS